ncbi:MAG: MFS transporter [Thaumarchaeota archaeon]|nr:MFS transporter [Nitrososphaerota archaeon]
MEKTDQGFHEDSKKPGLRNVYAMGLVSFFTDVSTEMVTGYLPVFIVKDLGGTKAILGLIEGAGELANNFFRMISGFLSDRLGKRKPLVFAGYAFSTISKPLFAVSTTPAEALSVRVMDRTGKGIRTSPRDALLSQSVDEKVTGKAFGLHRTLDQLGAILGPLLATILLPLIGPRPLFVASFIPGIIALLILWFLVVDVKTAPRKSQLLKGASKIVKGEFLLLLAILAIFGIGYYDFSFILVRSAELGITPDLVPLVYMAINLFHTAVGYPAGVLSDKIGREPLLATSFLLFSLTSLIFAYSSGLLAIILLVVFYGLYFGIYETVSRALVPRYAPSELRGTAYGLFYIVVGLSNLVGMSLVGFIWDNVGRTQAFTYSTLTGIIATVLASLLVIRARRKLNKEKQSSSL